MNKAELVDYVAENCEIYKKDAKYIVEAVLAGIQKGLREDNKVTLVGFGNFVMKKRPARMARDPRNGDKVRVPSKFVPTFKPSGKLKRYVG